MPINQAVIAATHISSQLRLVRIGWCVIIPILWWRKWKLREMLALPKITLWVGQSQCFVCLQSPPNLLPTNPTILPLLRSASCYHRTLPISSWSPLAHDGSRLNLKFPPSTAHLTAEALKLSMLWIPLVW